MTLHLTLAPGQDGTYPAGTFATNQGESVLRGAGDGEGTKSGGLCPSCAGESKTVEAVEVVGRDPVYPPL